MALKPKPERKTKPVVKLAEGTAQELAAYGKTPKDAEEFYVAHLKRKKSTGARPGTGKTSIDPQTDQATDIRARLLHGGRPDWRMMRLQALITEQKKESRLADNYLSARAAAFHAALQVTPPGKRYLLLDTIDALWRDVVIEFERAVLDGDFHWFKRQANVIRSGDTRLDSDKALDQFEASVARELERCFWKTRYEERKHHPDIEAASLEPAGKRTGVTPKQVLECFKTRKERYQNPKSGQTFSRFYVSTKTVSLKTDNEEEVGECCFESARRAREAIKRIARLHGYELAVSSMIAG